MRPRHALRNAQGHAGIGFGVAELFLQPVGVRQVHADRPVDGRAARDAVDAGGIVERPVAGFLDHQRRAAVAPEQHAQLIDGGGVLDQARGGVALRFEEFGVGIEGPGALDGDLDASVETEHGHRGGVLS